MAKTELKLKSKRSTTGQNITTTIGYVNPDADSVTLKTFGQKLNAMTTNIYEETDRVQTINVDTEQVPGQGKENPTLGLGTWVEEDGQYYAPIIYSGDTSTVKLAYRQRVTQNNNVEIMDYEGIGKVVYGAANIQAVLYVAETSEYNAAFFEFTSNQS